MRFLPTLTTLLLGLTSARAYLEDDLPPGYKVTKVIEVPVDSRWPEVQDNEDNIPLYNAQLRCTINPYGFYLYGRHWDGVSEHWIKKVITHTKGEENKRTISTGMHDWNFERKKEEGMWEAQVSFFLLDLLCSCLSFLCLQSCWLGFFFCSLLSNLLYISLSLSFLWTSWFANACGFCSSSFIILNSPTR
jgi:hypothetical protein